MSESISITSKVEAFYSSCATSSILPDKSAYSNRVAAAFGYSVEELQNIPENAKLGLSCGNPLSTANLKEVWRIFFTIDLTWLI